MRIQRAFCLFAPLVVAAGCAASTAFNSTWRNPELRPVRLDGQKVIVLVINTQETVRRGAEDTVAAQITERGAQGVAAWTVLPTADMQSEEKARAAFAKVGAQAVVSMQIVAQGRDPRSPNFSVSMSTGSRGGFWGHYNSAWRTTWHSGPAPNTLVFVETMLHSLEPENLLWGGRSQSVNPSAIPTLFGDVANAAARELERAGLLKGPE
jgi:hypothetical protein